MKIKCILQKTWLIICYKRNKITKVEYCTLEERCDGDGVIRNILEGEHVGVGDLLADGLQQGACHTPLHSAKLQIDNTKKVNNHT